MTGSEPREASVRDRPILYHAPRSPFALKVRVAVAELGLSEGIDLVQVDPWTDETLRHRNPLCQVPTLATPDGVELFGSAVIVRYLDDLVAGGLLPAKPRLWAALAREAAADGMVLAVVRRFVERLEPLAERTERVVLRQEAAVAAVLGDAERHFQRDAEDIDIGHVALASAISYLDRRSPEIEWRRGRPAVSAWYDAFLARPSAAVLVAAAGG